MFGFRKKKVARKELDNYIVELSDEKVLISTKAPLWRLEYNSATSPYALFSAAWNDDETLSTVCLYLMTSVSMVTEAKYVLNTIKSAFEYAKSKEKAPKVSKAEDEAILRETEALHEQTQEAVEKHISATKKKATTKRKKK